MRGVEVTCFIRWSKKGCISSTILKEALKTLDLYDLCPRENGVKTFLLVDGHGSRCGLPFLEYINNKDNKWKVYIGVLYGTRILPPN